MDDRSIMAAPVGTAPPPLPQPPAARRSLIAKAVAIVGIVGGFLLYVVPGIFAFRSYMRWTRAEIPRPTFAWIMAPVSVVAAALVVGSLVLLYSLPLVDDDFSDPTSGWPTDERTSYTDGALEIRVDDQPYLTGLRWEEGAVPNVAVEARIRSIGTAAVGCADSTSGDGYAFRLGADGGFAVLRFDDGGTSYETLSSGRIGEGSAADGAAIRGECRAGYGEHELRFIVDGELVARVDVAPSVFDFDAMVLVAGPPVGGGAATSRFDDARAIAIQPSA